MIRVVLGLGLAGVIIVVGAGILLAFLALTLLPLLAVIVGAITS